MYPQNVLSIKIAEELEPKVVIAEPTMEPDLVLIHHVVEQEAFPRSQKEISSEPTIDFQEIPPWMLASHWPRMTIITFFGDPESQPKPFCCHERLHPVLGGVDLRCNVCNLYVIAVPPEQWSNPLRHSIMLGPNGASVNGRRLLD